MARSGGVADLRADGGMERAVQRIAGHALHGHAGFIADRRNDADVSLDVRLSRGAVAEADFRPATGSTPDTIKWE
jgi:hypothetical protein